jgi:DNA invertase Pin-like site-specific DNA recombinase
LLLKIGAAYVRVSDERQDEYSPDSQLKKVREYAAKEGYTIPDEYVFYDDGISGKSTKKRNEFNRMIATAKEKDHPFDKIYVWKFSRFARNQEEAMVYKNLLRKKDVAVVSVSEPIPEGHFGTLIERIIEWMDEFYLINLSAEVARGLQEKVSRGEPICPPAFGYDIKDKMYYPNEEKAPIVREIFTRYSQGEKMRAIAIDLGNKGVRTKRGCKPSNRWVEYILYNPVYIGKIRWSIDGERATRQRDYDSEKLMIVDGHHEPIIDMELWEKVQVMLGAEKMAYPKFVKKEQAVKVMSKGLIKCSSCGGSIVVSSAKSGKAKLPTLQCCNYSRGACSVSHSIVVPKIENAIIEGIKQAVKTQTFKISPERKKVVKETPNYDKLIAIEERKLERARQSYLAEIDSLEVYAENKKEIEKTITELKTLKENSASTNAEIPPTFVSKVEGVLEFIQSEKVSVEAKNEALRSIIDKVVFDKSKDSVSIFFYA